jgi:Fic family protein
MSADINRFYPALGPPEVAATLRLLGEIEEFKGQWRKLREIRAERLSELRQVTTIESAGSSTRIEGAELTDEEVARVLGGLSIDSFRARDEAEVRGYGELLQTIFDSFSEIPLEERFIQQLHQILLHHSDRDARHRGQYKTLDNHVEARYADGRSEIIFHTASPFDTPRLMTELVGATNTALADQALHPLVAIARFIVEFLAIHPFQDGNGRLARALTSLLLLRAGYEYVPYSSLERVIEENKETYYVALRASQLAIRTLPNNFGEWLTFFLRTLRVQQQNLAAKLDVERSMLALSAVQERVLGFIALHGRATTTLIARETGLPARTIRYHLDVLSQRGIVEAHGEKRGRYYRRASGTTLIAPGPESRTAEVLAEILQNGGRIRTAELKRLVKRHGYDPRVVGTLHGRRLAHLRRDPRTGDSVLTSRGREIAQQHLFAIRLSRPVTTSIE